MNRDELKLLQNYPLNLKIEKTRLRIREWYEHWNGDVYVSFSGGKDSTVLLDICRKLYPDMPAVFINTGVEYPEIVKFVKSFDNITILKPIKPFHKVIKENGYPIISKTVSNKLRVVQKNKDNCSYYKWFTEETKNSRYNCSKWAYLIDAPFKVSNLCCDYLKKMPVKKYEKETGYKPIVGTMASESIVRTDIYLKQGGCNSFDNKRPISTPLGFWTDQDIYKYIIDNNLKIAPIYGNIIKDANGNYMTTGVRRTGCMYCGFGAHLEKYPNRYQQLKNTHPKQYDYMLNKLGFKEVLDFIGIPYVDKQNKLF